MADDNIKNLAPEDRIKKLKELEKKRKQEIEEAQKMIRESETEITERRKWVEKVPIPEAAQDDLAGLSEDAKVILKEQKGLVDKKRETEETDGSKVKNKTRGQEQSLEETIEKSKISKPTAFSSSEAEEKSFHQQIMQSAYTRELSKTPMEDLYKRAAEITSNVEEKGYVSSAEKRDMAYITGAIEEKFQAYDAGRYNMTEEVAMAGSLIQRLGAKVGSMYETGRARLRNDQKYLM